MSASLGVSETVSNAAERDARFAAILAAYGGSITRVAGTYTRGAAERDDLAQEIAVALWQALPRFRGECSEKTFVFRIAHNRGITHATRRKTFAPEVDVVDERAPDPEGSLGTAERHAALLAAVRGLPLSQREVVTLALEELSYEEIADVLGTTTSNVGVRLNRAKEALRAKMGGSR
jgi:RNA polymerase sigma-70 factor (ECF subfamily)